jgi:predicted TIM-barrel fold metal-dependent hydrolase
MTVAASEPHEEPITPLIDTHQHLMYPDRLAYGWTRGMPALEGRAFTLEDYRALTRGAGIAATLFMECAVDDGQEAREVEVIEAIAARPNSGIAGIVASCRPEHEDFPETLERLAGRVRGFRRVLHVVPDEVSRGTVFRANVRRIGAAGLPFDLCLLARQLPLGLELVRAAPETCFVLDHCGVPDIAGGGLDPWRAHVRALADEENVVAKVSGVLAYCDPARAGPDAVSPYLEHVIDSFGPERCLWGSDWPVVNVTASLPLWLEITRSLLDQLSADEAAAIAHRTASRVYGLPPAT